MKTPIHAAQTGFRGRRPRRLGRGSSGRRGSDRAGWTPTPTRRRSRGGAAMNTSDHPEPTARRSAAWFAAEGRNGFIHRSWMRNQGFGPEVFDGRPVIGIANSWSELTPCNAHLRDVAEAVKRGVWEAGGLPLEF